MEVDFDRRLSEREFHPRNLSVSIGRTILVAIERPIYVWHSTEEGDCEECPKSADDMLRSVESANDKTT